MTEDKIPCVAVSERRSALPLNFGSGRPAVAAAPLGHELVEFGLVLGVAQALQKLPEFLLLLSSPFV
jgi:hypothetical protein